MPSVDQILDNGSYRIPVSSLTDEEKTSLAEQGMAIDGRDFVDLAMDTPQVVDPKQEKRQEAAKQLMAAVNPQIPSATPQPTVDAEQVKALKDRIKELEDVLRGIPQTCNRCDWPTAAKVSVEPTKEDIKDFLRSVMAGEVFTKAYKLFGDRVEVVFRTRSGTEEQRVKSALREMLRSGKIVNETDLIATSRQMNFACALKSFTSPHTKLVFDAFEIDESVPLEDPLFISTVQSRINRLPSQLQHTLLRQFDLFSELVELLLSKAGDLDFWRGTESSLY